MPVPIEHLLEHASWVRSLAARLVRDAADADDVVQQVWLAALDRPPTADRPVRPWLAGVVRNLARMRARGAARRERHERAAPVSVDDLPGPAELAERLELERRLACHVAALDEPFRSTVLLRYAEGVSSAEIARRQGLPEGTVRWRLKRGLDALRARFDAESGGDRRAWVLLLVPLARNPPCGIVPRTAPAAGVLTGVVAVTLWTKLVLGGAVAALAVLAVSAVMSPTGSGFAPDIDDPAELAHRPLPSRRERTRAPEERSDDHAAGDSAAASTTSDDDTLTERTPEDTRATLRLRVVDATGNGIPDAVIRADGEDVSTDAEGRAVLRVPAQAGGDDVTLLVRGDGLSTLHRRVVVEPRATIDLGDVRLEPGGAVSGRVVDAAGAPVAGAWVGLGEPGPLQAHSRRRRLASRAGLVTGATSRTLDDGTFLVSGLPVGMQRLWAGRDGYLATPSRPVQVRAGQESFGLELILDPEGPADFVRGRVLGPDGRPAARADVRYSYASSFGSSGTGTLTAETDGTFRIAAEDGGTYTLAAASHDGTLVAVGIDDVSPGDEVTLRLAASRPIALRVLDPEGRDVTSFTATVCDPPTGSHYATFEHDAATAPRASEVACPPGRFEVHVDAHGYDLAVLGPFAADARPQELTARLVRLPGVRGVVVDASGAPVADARVTLQALVPDDEVWTHDGFRTLVDPTETAAGRSDGSGAFHLTLRSAGAFVLRVESDAAGVAEQRLGRVEPGAGRQDLRVALAPGGAIEVRVTDGRGRPAVGAVVGVSRADGRPRTMRAGPDGTCRLDDLMPGPWLVELTEREISPLGHETMTHTGRAALPPWTTEVRSGATSVVHLRTDHAGTPSLTGRLTLDGEPARGWSAHLVSPEEMRADSSRAVLLDDDGRFTATAPRDGTWRLLLTGGAAGFVVAADVDVGAGAAPWSLALETGSLTVTGLPRSGSGERTLAAVWTPARGVVALVPLLGDAEGRVELTLAPAGTVRICRVPDDGAASLETSHWEERANGVVRSRGHLDLDLTR